MPDSHADFKSLAMTVKRVVIFNYSLILRDRNVLGGFVTMTENSSITAWLSITNFINGLHLLPPSINSNRGNRLQQTRKQKKDSHSRNHVLFIFPRLKNEKRWGFRNSKWSLCEFNGPFAFSRTYVSSPLTKSPLLEICVLIDMICENICREERWEERSLRCEEDETIRNENRHHRGVKLDSCLTGHCRKNQFEIVLRKQMTAKVDEIILQVSDLKICSAVRVHVHLSYLKNF